MKNRFVKVILWVIRIIVVLILAVVIAVFAMANHRSDPKNVKTYNTSNPYIVDKTEVSAHRSGGGIAPEQTMMAFKNCAENPEFTVDIFEFDLHITKNNVLVLLHDSTLDRTSDAEAVFGETEVRPENKTYDELRQLNMGAKFINADGEMPYADLSGDEVPDELKILSLDEVLDYLMSVGDYKYILEIKNGGELGRKAADIMYEMLEERNLFDKVIFGTFNEEVTQYVDDNYPKLVRSANMGEVVEFYIASMINDKDYEPPFTVLQIPFCNWEDSYYLNFGTAKVINYAHSKNLAVQYWTINDAEDMEYLISIGADAIMSDYPDILYNAVNS